MAKRDSAARRYAEAAFQVAQRDGTVDAWRRELEDAATVVAVPSIGHTLANPSVALETRAASVETTLGQIASRPVLNLIQLMLRRGRIEDLPHVAAEFRRLDNAQKGITIATATSAAPLSAAELKALTCTTRSTHRRFRSNWTSAWTRACSVASSSRSATA